MLAFIPLLFALAVFGEVPGSKDLTNWTLWSSAVPELRYSVSVPCTVVGCLLESGHVPFDPFFGKNIERFNKSDFVVPWTFETQFEITTNATQVLHVDGVNYRATLHVNEVLVADSSTIVGAFRRYTFDISRFVIIGQNTIRFEVTQSAHDPRHWRNNSTDLGISFDDWAPHPPDLSMGLWRPVRLQTLPFAAPVTMEGAVVHSQVDRSISHGYEAFLNVSVVATNWGAQSVSVAVWVDLGYPGLDPMSTTVTLGPNASQRIVWSWEDLQQLRVADPLLWWPWQIGDRKLFNMSAGIGAETLLRARYGIREVSTTLTSGGALQFRVNHIPLLIRAGGWAPDLFLRNNVSRLQQQFRLIRDMGMNAIRLEGKMEYEAFFDFADDFGILVLPGINCCDGWQNWPSWGPEQYRAARLSLANQARRLGHHASVAAFLISSDELPPVDVEAMYDAALRAEAWPNPIVSSASQEASTITGISGVKMVGPYSWEPPSYWLVDGNGLKDFNGGGAWGFFTEGGPGEAPMTMASWRRTVPADHLWSSEGAMDSWWSAHMGCPYGHFRNLTYFNPPFTARYGASKGAHEYLFKAQASNYEGIRSYFESYNRNKHRNATGFVQWMMNDAYPTHLWHLYDWYLVGGGGYYGAKKANEPLHVMMSYNDGSVWIINSAFKDVGPVQLNATLRRLSGVKVWTREQYFVVIPSDATIETKIRVPMDGDGIFVDDETFFVHLEWGYNGRVVENWYWIEPSMDKLDFPQSNGFRTPCTQWANFTSLNHLGPAVISTNLSFAGSLALVSIRNAGPSVAFFVHLRFVDQQSLDIAPQLWSDNFVTIPPGESRDLSCDLSAVIYPAWKPGTVELVVESWNDLVEYSALRRFFSLH